MVMNYFNALPISQQLSLRLRGEILSGIYRPGSPFPAVRQIACNCAINPNTVQRALSQLEDEGLLVTNGTIGRTVTADEGVLAAARAEVQNSFLSSMKEQAERLAISPETIISFFQDGSAVVSPAKKASPTISERSDSQ